MSNQAVTSDDSGRADSDRGALRGQQRPLAKIQFVLLPAVLFVLIPAHVLALSAQDFATFDPVGFVLLGMTAVVVMLLLLALAHVESRTTTRRYFSVLVEFVLFFVVITGFVLPASARSGMIDAQSAPADVGHLLIASATAFALLLLAATARRRSLYAAVVAFVGVNALLTLPGLYSLVAAPATASPTDATSVFSLSRDRNVLVMSFDGIPGSAALEALERDPELKERFAGFTFYTGAASSSPLTSPSIATSLYGNPDYTERHQTVEELWASAPEKLITNQLDQHGWLVSTYGDYGLAFRDRSRAYARLAPRPPPSPFRLLNYGLARSLTRLFAVSGSLADDLDHAYATALATLTGSTYDPSKEFIASHVPWWKRGRFTPTVFDYDEYLDKLQVATDEPVAHFMHFTHTHIPIEFDGECRWAASDERWFLASQDPDGAAEQTRCALTQLADYLDRLRTLGAFDDSLVILKSDHGLPPSYYDTDSTDSFRIRGDPRWGYGRYAPFLAIKEFGPARAALRLDDHPVLLDDLARTLCVHAGLDVDCETYNGFDLLGDEWSAIEDDEITLFLVVGEGTKYAFDTYEPISIKRGVDILASMHGHLSAEMLRSSVSCAEGVDVTIGQPLDNGRSDHRSWLTWHDRGSSFLRFRMDEPCASMTLLISDEGSAIASGDVAFFVDGEAIDVGSEGSTTRSESSSGLFSIRIPSSMLGASRDVVVEIRPDDRNETDPILVGGVDFSR